MTTSGSSVGMVLNGGELLLHPSGVRVVRAAMGALQRALDRDGIGLPSDGRSLLDLLDQAPATAAPVSVRTAGSGSPAVRSGPEPAPSALLDPVTASEVARMLDCEPRNARDLCKRGAFPSARLVAGRWLLERADVLARRQAA